MMLRSFVLLLMSRALSGHGTSKETRSLFNVLNGAYDNLDQVQNENSGNDVIFVYTFRTFIPIDVLELGPNPVLFSEQVTNMRTQRLNVLAVVEESYSQITLAIYNVTGPRFYEKPPGSITVDDVSNLQLGDLQRIDNCVARFQTIDDNLLVGVWQNCFDSNDEIRSQEVIIVRGIYIYVVVPPDAPGTSTLVPYHFVRRGPRFPIPGETSNSDNADD